MSNDLIKYPSGALLRVKDICGDKSAGRPGILPIVPRTWLKWVEQGKVPQGQLLGSKTRVWPIEVVLDFAHPRTCGSSDAAKVTSPQA